MIQGNKFKALTPLHYAPARLYTGHMDRDELNNLPYNDYRYLKNTIETLKDGDLVYTHTFYADQLFERLNKKITLITHNCDVDVSFAPPDNVLKWFSTNVNIVHERVFSIPIGIENDFWLKDKRAIMERKLQNQKKYKNLLYMNHNVRTNPNKRQRPYDILKNKNFVTCHMGANGSGFDNYIDNVYNHPFVIAPEGNGIDTHRFWECLYMRTIPVVLKNINNSFYSDLPVLFLDSWDELSDTFLHDKFMEFSRKEWNLEKLNFEYWKRLITGK